MRTIPTTLSTFALVLAFLTVFCSRPAGAQKTSLGAFDGQTDVGTNVKPGGVEFDPASGIYRMRGSGSNMWADHDEFHYLWKRMKGDFILTTRASLIGKGVEQHRKIGWNIRTSLDGNSPHVTGVVHGDGLTSLQFRKTPGAVTEQVTASITAADVIQIERHGNKYTLSVARFGDPFVTEEVSDIQLGDEVYVGLFVCAHNKDVIENAAFQDVRITVPAPDNFTPYRDYIGSQIELMNVETGQRKIIFNAVDSLQAPNWTPDGKNLIYNHNGKLVRLDLATNSTETIDTGFATNNNNDHVLSFDGRMIGISNHDRQDGNKSKVFVLPVKGGTPQRITPTGPSYLHSWTPDGKFLIFTGSRNDEFDIYKVPAKGGDEIRLTTATGLDDGPECTPDGKYIYFNSTRTGLMQLWRMKIDGSDQVQITNDEYNNWFPHISPNGKWIVFITFPKDITPTDHPFYKHVYIRIMPIEGGKPKVLAYVYGGQGTINVPSWSPDSKRVAFVSNTVIK